MWIIDVMNFVYEIELNWSIQCDDCCDESTDGKEKQNQIDQNICNQTTVGINVRR